MRTAFNFIYVLVIMTCVHYLEHRTLPITNHVSQKT